MNEQERKKQMAALIELAMDHLGVAVTIIDTNGILLYYNWESARILDRKPEYAGTNIHSHHKKPNSNKKLDMMLEAFKGGRKDPFHYKAKPYGKIIFVTLSPMIRNGEFVGCIQTIRPNCQPTEEQAGFSVKSDLDKHL
jgi:DUF438 domain-containing protein